MEEVVRRLTDGDFGDDCLDQLKILCREENNSLRIFNDGDLFTGLCGLRKESAYMVLANILFYVKEARQQLVGSLLFSDILKGMDGQVESFIELRLVFLITTELDGSRQAADQVYLALTKVNCNEVDKVNFVEILRILHNVSRVKPLPTVLVKQLVNCLEDDNVDIVGNAFNCLINTDNDQQLFAPPLSDGFKSLLKGDLDGHWECILSASVVIKRQCDSFVDVRGYLRHALLPSIKDRESTHRNDDFISKLGMLQSHKKSELAMSIGDMLFALVEKKVVRLVYHFGYGPIAGYLYNRSLLQCSSNTNDEGLGSSSDEEDIRNGALNDVDLVTGLKRQLNDLEMISEEEKERETDRLLDLFERMEKNGIIKFFTAEKK